MKRSSIPIASLALAALLGTWGVLAGAAAGAAPNLTAQDRSYLITAHQSHLAEIAAGRDAQQNARSRSVKVLGGVFVTDHTALDRDITALADKYGVRLPDTPTPQQRADLVTVQRNAGAAYDSEWLRMETIAHQNAKVTGAGERVEGSARDIIDEAQAEAKVIDDHLNRLAAARSSIAASPSPTRTATAQNRSTPPRQVPAGNGGQASGPGRADLAAALAFVGTLLVIAAMAAIAWRYAATWAPVSRPVPERPSGSRPWSW